MGAHAIRLLGAVVVLALGTADAQSRTLKGTRQLHSASGDSFEDRMQMYTQWAKLASHGRSLSHLSDSPLPAPATPPSPGSQVIQPPPSPESQVVQPPPSPESQVVQPPTPITQVVQPTPGSQVVQPTPGSQVVQPPTPLSQVVQPTTPPGASTPAGTGAGGCKVLKYYTGFANTTLYYNRTVNDTPNFGECCKRCQEDPYCVAWTRVAGGDAPNFRKCYLKYDFKALDQSPDRLKGNHEGHPGDTEKYPELRYVDEGYADPNAPIILESGTIPDYYPADYYGCPYKPGNPTTPCVAPPTCNVDGNGVFVAPPCI